MTDINGMIPTMTVLIGLDTYESLYLKEKTPYETETSKSLYSHTCIPNTVHGYSIPINAMTRKEIHNRIEQLKKSLRKSWLETYERHRIEQHIFHLQQELAKLNRQQ